MGKLHGGWTNGSSSLGESENGVVGVSYEDVDDGEFVSLLADQDLHKGHHQVSYSNSLPLLDQYNNSGQTHTPISLETLVHSISC